MDKYLLHIVPRGITALRRITGTGWTESLSNPGVWYRDFGDVMDTTVLPRIGATSGFLLYEENTFTAEQTTYTFVTDVATCESTPFSYTVIGDNNLYVNPDGDPDDPLRIFFYYIKFLDDALYRMWFSDVRLNFVDAPPALPLLVSRGYTLTETLSSLKAVSITDTDLRLEIANPVQADGKRYMTNVSRAMGQNLRVHWDDPMFTDALCILYRGTSDDPTAFQYSPDHASTVFEEVYRGNLRPSLWNYNYLQRAQIKVTITRSLSQIGEGNLILDRLDRVAWQTQFGTNVPKVFGEMHIRCSVHEGYMELSVGHSYTVWLKVCAGPVYEFKELRINGSDPFPIGVYQTDGWRVVADVRTGWIGIPGLLIEPYLLEGQENFIDVIVVGNLLQHSSREEWNEFSQLIFDSDYPPSGIIEDNDFGYTRTLPLNWSQSNCVAANADFGGGIVGLEMDISGTPAAAWNILNIEDFLWMVDVHQIEFRIRIRGPLPDSFSFQATQNVATGLVTVSGLTNLSVNTWYTLKVIIHPDEQDIGNGLTAKVDMDNFAVNHMSLIAFIVTGGTGSTFFDVDWIKFYRLGQASTPTEIAQEITYQATTIIADGWPDGSLVSQGIDSVRENDDATWEQDYDKVYSTGNYVIRLDPLQNLTLKIPDIYTDEDELLVTVKASPLLSEPRGAPFSLWCFTHSGKVINPTLAQRQDTVAIGRTTCDECFYQDIVFKVPANAQYVTFQYVPPGTPTRSQGSSYSIGIDGRIPNADLKRIFAPGSSIILLPLDSTNGITYQKAALGSPSKTEFQVRYTTGNGQIAIDTFMNPSGHFVALNLPLYIGEISLRRNYIQINELTKESVDIINPSGVVIENTALITLLDQFYKETGIIPAPTREGNLDFRNISVSEELHRIELIDDGRERNYDPRSVTAVGDVDRLWYNTINAKGSYNHAQNDYDVNTGFNTTDLNLPQSLFPVYETVYMNWRRGITAVRQRARFLLDISQEVRAFNLIVIRDLVETVRAGSILRMPAEEFGFPYLDLVVKTVSPAFTINEEAFATVLGVAFHYVLFNDAIVYEAGSAKWDGLFTYC